MMKPEARNQYPWGVWQCDTVCSIKASRLAAGMADWVEYVGGLLHWDIGKYMGLPLSG